MINAVRVAGVCWLHNHAVRVAARGARWVMRVIEDGIVQFQVRVMRPPGRYVEAVRAALEHAGFDALRWAVVATEDDCWVIEGAGWRLTRFT
jgi:hypothetical protein